MYNRMTYLQVLLAKKYMSVVIIVVMREINIIPYCIFLNLATPYY